ncbi:nicotinamide N-methyltransferase-like [Actinia tenebrosa]|uniref:Nicotinamide N-methyltransferase-like n=1 Tax=Actinia tenebrosa TaxID=6105 RepID=A0A6P8IDP0_ACTTE|nr:nicotinamide N-methyltransferase-like [Actinia tenebrosa]
MTTKDYESFFDPYNYMDTYFKDPMKEPYSLRHLKKFWSKIGGSSLKVLEYGGGPTISRLVSATPHAREIIFAEYLKANRQAVQAWIDKDPIPFDWRPAFDFIVRELEGKGPDEVVKREDELRQKIRTIVPCNLKAENILEIPASLGDKYGPPYDVVATSLCLEAVVESEQEYKDTVTKLAKLVKPGGYLMMHGVLEQTFYTVCSKKFYTFYLTKEMVEESMTNAGVKDIEMDLASSDLSVNASDLDALPLADLKDLFFVYGKM